MTKCFWVCDKLEKVVFFRFFGWEVMWNWKEWIDKLLMEGEFFKGYAVCLVFGRVINCFGLFWTEGFFGILDF